jgi:hypothetical protein
MNEGEQVALRIEELGISGYIQHLVQLQYELFSPWKFVVEFTAYDHVKLFCLQLLKGNT